MSDCGTTSGIIKATNLPTTCASGDTVTTILNTLFVIIGAIAVLMVVIGGFRYIRAGANETIVSEAKRQIAHALIGLIVAASAAIIVNFVIKRAG